MKKEFNDYKDVSFLPIDLPYEKINLDELEVFHDRNYLWPPDVIKESYGGGAVKDAPYVEEHPHQIWRIVCLLGQLDDHEFSDPKAVRRSWVNRLERKQPVKINPALPKELYGVIKLIDQLPIQCNHAELIRQRKDVAVHHDVSKLGTDGHKQLIPFEPSGYRLLINDIRKPSFYFSKHRNDIPIEEHRTYLESHPEDKDYINLPMDTNTFVINELWHPHGADKIDEQKFVVTTTGALKPEEHIKVLNRSWEKYKDYVIQYEKD